MSADVLNVSTHCRSCLAALTLEEMHYLDNGDGSATCEACERKWGDDLRDWLASDGSTPQPERP